jgi:hypothetical protein
VILLVKDGLEEQKPEEYINEQDYHEYDGLIG